MTDIDITTSTIRRLRERDITLRAELADVNDELVALGVNPHLEPLIVAILIAASRTLSTWRLYEHTKELGLHQHSMKDFVLHLDRLHAAGTIVPVGEKKWVARRPAPPLEPLAPPGALID